MDVDAMRALRDSTPLGHILPAHYVHGRCSHCAGWGIVGELEAWRAWALALLTTGEQGARSGT